MQPGLSTLAFSRYLQTAFSSSLINCLLVNSHCIEALLLKNTRIKGALQEGKSMNQQVLTLSKSFPPTFLLKELNLNTFLKFCLKGQKDFYSADTVRYHLHSVTCKAKDRNRNVLSGLKPGGTRQRGLTLSFLKSQLIPML